jgi:hypothetical protein
MSKDTHEFHEQNSCSRLSSTADTSLYTIFKPSRATVNHADVVLSLESARSHFSCLSTLLLCRSSRYLSHTPTPPIVAQFAFATWDK